MRVLIFLYLFLLSSSLWAMEKNGFDLSATLIANELIKFGGPAKDGIASIDRPIFLPAKQALLKSDQRVVGVFYNGVAKAYPINILNWHEVVNDYFDEHPVMVSYCPLCGSAMVFDAQIQGQRLEFGVSGLLYDSDVLLYDRQTESLWSQLLEKAVSGPFKAQNLTLLPSMHTTFEHWLQLHPESLVLSENTGFKRDYDRDPYQGYSETKRLYFDVSNTSAHSLHPKQWVLGLKLNEVSKAYPLNILKEGKLSRVIEEIDGQQVIIEYNQQANTAFATDLEGNVLPTVLSYWFAWYTFNPQTQLYLNPSQPH